jgi:hypothetical protein
MAALDLTQHPQHNVHLQESLRPMAERLRNILYAGQANMGRHVEFMTLLASHPDQSAPLVDGRAGEGLQPLTVGEALTACQFLVAMLQWSQIPPNLDNGTTALRLCVRPFQVS